MDWTQFVIFALGVFGLFIWNRTETRTDIRHMDTKLEGQRALLQAIWQESKEGQSKTMEMIQAIHLEMKDFHGRLCAIEEKNKKPRSPRDKTLA